MDTGSNQSELAIEIQTSEPGLSRQFVEELTGLSGGAVTVRSNGEELRPGAFDTTVIMNFVVSVTAGVSARMLSEWILEVLKDRAKRITIGGTDVDRPTPESLTAALAQAPAKESP